MLSKISCFNAAFNMAVFKKYMKNALSLIIIYFITLLIPALNLFIGFSQQDGTAKSLSDNFQSFYEARTSGVAQFIDATSGRFAIVMASIFAICIMVSIFSHLYSTKTAYMMASFPINRLQMFFTGIVAALLTLIVPQVIVSLMLLLLGIKVGIAGAVGYVFYGLLCQLLADLFFVAFAACVTMLSGQSWVCLLVYPVLNFTYFMINTTISLLKMNVCFGLSDLDGVSFDNFFTPMVYFPSVGVRGLEIISDEYSVFRIEVRPADTVTQLCYLGAAVLLLALGYFIYSKKKLETVQDFIAVPVLKPIFRWTFSLFAALFFADGIAMLWSDVANLSLNSRFLLLMILTLILGLLIFIACQALIKRSYRVFDKSFFKEAGVFAAFILILFTVFRLDLFGIERKLPNTSEVEKVIISASDVATVYDEDEIKTVIDLHEKLIDCKSELCSVRESATDERFDIRYILKNGSVLKRSYLLIDEATGTDKYKAAYKNISDFVCNPEFILKHMIMNVDNVGYSEKIHADAMEFDVYKYQDEVWNCFSELLTDADAEKIFQAYILDIKAGALNDRFLRKRDNWGMDEKHYVNSLAFHIYSEDGSLEKATALKNQYVTEAIEETYATPHDLFKFGDNIVYVSFTADCKNTVNALIDAGLITDAKDLITEPMYFSK